MSLPQEAQQGWINSAEGWFKFVSEGDLNRTHVLDPVMLREVGCVQEKKILDIGCGEGRFARMLAARGGKVTGIDLTEPLVLHARELDPLGDYRVGNAEQLPFPNEAFDLAVSYLVLIDVPDYRRAIQEMARILRKGGHAIVANVNPFAGCGDGWEKNEKGEKLYYKVDRYFEERAIRYDWRGMSILNWHRPLEQYMSAFLESGFALERFLEPQPTAEAVADQPWIADGLRVPSFTVMVWAKQ